MVLDLCNLIAPVQQPLLIHSAAGLVSQSQSALASVCMRPAWFSVSEVFNLHQADASDKLLRPGAIRALLFYTKDGQKYAEHAQRAETDNNCNRAADVAQTC